jgi:hypothetical protein
MSVAGLGELQRGTLPWPAALHDFSQRAPWCLMGVVYDAAPVEESKFCGCIWPFPILASRLGVSRLVPRSETFEGKSMMRLCGPRVDG